MDSSVAREDQRSMGAEKTQVKEHRRPAGHASGYAMVASLEQRVAELERQVEELQQWAPQVIKLLGGQAEAIEEIREGDFFKVEAVADEIGTCGQTLRNWVRDGKIKASWKGGHLAVSLSEARAYHDRPRRRPI